MKVTDVVPGVKAPSITFVLESVVTSVMPLETPSVRWRNAEYKLKEAHRRIHSEELSPIERVVNRKLASAYIERDVSASQTQVLAAFLGNDALAALAGSRSPKFKVYLAQRLWALHEKHEVLKDGYDGPGDEGLTEFIGEIWMRRNYGGKLGQTVLDLANRPSARDGTRTSSPPEGSNTLIVASRCSSTHCRLSGWATWRCFF